MSGQGHMQSLAGYASSPTDSSLAQIDPSLFPTRNSKRRSTSIYASPARWSPPPGGDAVVPLIEGEPPTALPALPTAATTKAEEDQDEDDFDEDYEPRHLIDSDAVPIVSGKRVRRPKAPPTLIVNTPKQLKKRRTGSYVPSDMAEASIIVATAHTTPSQALPPLPVPPTNPDPDSLPALPPLVSDAQPSNPSPSTHSVPREEGEAVPSETFGAPAAGPDAPNAAAPVAVEQEVARSPEVSTAAHFAPANPPPDRAQDPSELDFSTVSATDEPMDALSAVAAAIAAADRSAKANALNEASRDGRAEDASETEQVNAAPPNGGEARQPAERSIEASADSDVEVKAALIPPVSSTTAVAARPTSPARTPSQASAATPMDHDEGQTTQEEATDDAGSSKRRSSRRSGPPKWYDAATGPPSSVPHGFHPVSNGANFESTPAPAAVESSQPSTSTSRRTRQPRASTSSSSRGGGANSNLYEPPPSSSPAPYGGLPLLPSFARHLEAQRAGAIGGGAAAGGMTVSLDSPHGGYGQGMVDYMQAHEAAQRAGQSFNPALVAHDTSSSLGHAPDMSLNSPGGAGGGGGLPAPPPVPDFLQPSKRKRRRYPRGWQNPSDAMICANCQTDKSPLWRRNAQGAYECNACCQSRRAITRAFKSIVNDADPCSAGPLLRSLLQVSRSPSTSSRRRPRNRRGAHDKTSDRSFRWHRASEEPQAFATARHAPPAPERSRRRRRRTPGGDLGGGGDATAHLLVRSVVRRGRELVDEHAVPRLARPPAPTVAGRRVQRDAARRTRRVARVPEPVLSLVRVCLLEPARAHARILARAAHGGVDLGRVRPVCAPVADPARSRRRGWRIGCCCCWRRRRRRRRG